MWFFGRVYKLLRVQGNPTRLKGSTGQHFRTVDRRSLLGCTATLVIPYYHWGEKSFWYQTLGERRAMILYLLADTDNAIARTTTNTSLGSFV
jgi:hypothetical protein